MRIGKVKESILKRSVLRQLHNHSEEGSPAPGEDAGVLFMPEFSEDAGVALSVNPIEGWTFAAKRAVYGAVNSMLAAGAKIKAISLSVLMPQDTEEKQLKFLMKEIDALCTQEDILVISGHTAVSPFCDSNGNSREKRGSPGRIYRFRSGYCRNYRKRGSSNDRNGACGSFRRKICTVLY